MDDLPLLVIYVSHSSFAIKIRAAKWVKCAVRADLDLIIGWSLCSYRVDRSFPRISHRKDCNTPNKTPVYLGTNTSQPVFVGFSPWCQCWAFQAAKYHSITTFIRRYIFQYKLLYVIKDEINILLSFSGSERLFRNLPVFTCMLRINAPVRERAAVRYVGRCRSQDNVIRIGKYWSRDTRLLVRLISPIHLRWPASRTCFGIVYKTV